MGLIHDIQKYQILQWDPYFHHSGDGWLSRNRIFLNLDLNLFQSYIILHHLTSSYILSLWFSNSCIFGVQCCRPYTFQTLTAVRSNNISLKYQIFMTLSSKNIGIRKFHYDIHQFVKGYLRTISIFWKSWKIVLPNVIKSLIIQFQFFL